tara:strand:+ start:544 stop:948 length:405 start_codon:yes stop_codon:yes gene_type:complete
MWTIHEMANFASVIGTCCGLFSRVPQVYRTYKTKSANDLSTNTMVINITANTCFLFYMIVNEQYPIMINCLSVITLEGSLIYMKKKFGKMKKVSSQTELSKMNLSDLQDETQAEVSEEYNWKNLTNMFRTTSKS